MADQYTQQQATEAVRAMNETMVKVSGEVTGLLADYDKVMKELENAGGPGGTITEELATELKALGPRINAVHEELPDVPQPEA